MLLIVFASSLIAESKSSLLLYEHPPHSIWTRVWSSSSDLPSCFSKI